MLSVSTIYESILSRRLTHATQPARHQAKLEPGCRCPMRDLLLPPYFLISPGRPLVLLAVLMTSVTPADSFTCVAGKGARSVHVFIDVNCSFCRQIESELALVDNVKAYYHLLRGRSPDSRQEAWHVWSASGQSEAWSVRG